jgi:XTP/dITP diphosphohydrolase
MTIFLASGNAHKKMEMQALFPDITLKMPLEAGIEFAPEETGDSFVENALIKAKVLYQMVKLPVIADDSGLCIDALGGAPGIYSARYAGDTPQHEKNRLLLAETNAAIEKAETRFENPRSCRFVCAMVLLLSQDRFFVAQETMEGRLVSTIDAAKGDGGFGYDPIVIPDGYIKTVSELSEDEKNQISHRGKAARRIMFSFPEKRGLQAESIK